MDLIEDFNNSVLVPQFRCLRLKPRQQELVIADVTRRLESALFHWNDLSFRNTILLLGTEEASFWNPRNTPLEVRALVVVAIRNSLIEDLGCGSHAYTKELRSIRDVLNDAQMPRLTGEAIKYFASVDLDDVQVAPQQDIFGSLSRRFPNAWRALSLLGNSVDVEIEFSLTDSAPEPIDFSTVQCTPQHIQIESGISPTMNAFLMELLTAFQKREAQMMVVPSWKGITRNPEKLLHVIDHALHHEATIITPNYLISGTYLARRNPLLRPSHVADELPDQLSNPIGLTKRHRETLASIELQ